MFQERYIARISLTALSMNLTSTGLAAGPPAKCPQTDSIGRSSALGIFDTSYSLSSGGKYRSVRPGITIALAVILPNARSKSPLYSEFADMSPCCQLHIIDRM